MSTVSLPPRTKPAVGREPAGGRLGGRRSPSGRADVAVRALGVLALTGIVAELESLGLTYFDDFFEMSGNWPAWLKVFVATAR